MSRLFASLQEVIARSILNQEPQPDIARKVSIFAFAIKIDVFLA